MALTATSVKAAKPRLKSYKLYDEKGLYLAVEPSGGKFWRFKFQYAGKEKKLAIGSFPTTTLKEARDKRDAARKQLETGIDPAAQKRADKLDTNNRAQHTFENVAIEYIDKREREGLASVTLSKARWLLKLLEVGLRGRPISEITAQELLSAIRKVEKQGNLETARRMRSFAGRVFRYGVATGRVDRDPSVDIRDALTTPTVTHRAAILDEKGAGALMRSIDEYDGQPSTNLALRLAPHVFVRPGELRHAEWAEFDLERAVWTIPGKKMKMGRAHHVPLSRQALEILSVAHKLSGHSQYVFPSINSSRRPISENTINGALRRLGYDKNKMSAHGFRAMASSLLNESGKWNPDAIERALAHGDTSAVRAAYHRSSYWKERVTMAQWWSDYLEAMKIGGAVLQFRK